jgi:hypothetical protein
MAGLADCVRWRGYILAKDARKMRQESLSRVHASNLLVFLLVQGTTMLFKRGGSRGVVFTTINPESNEEVQRREVD